MRIRLWPQFSTAPQSPAEAIVRPRIWDALHVFVLFNFAVAQPVYDRLSERAALFVDQLIGMPVAFLLAALLSAGIPAVIVLVEWLAGFCGRRWYETLHCSVVLVFLFLLALPICKQADFLYGTGMIVCSSIGAALATWLYLKHRSVRAVMTAAALGIVLFPAIFLVQFSANFVKIAPTSQRSERWKPVPVVVLVFDEFCGSSLMTPERKIDAQRFPNLAALARDTTWFRNATSVNPMTTQALPAILSGQYPIGSYPPIAANLPQNLFSVLGASGYDRAVFEPVSSLATPGTEATLNAPQGLLSQTAFVANFLWRVYLFHVAPIEYQGHLPEIPRLWFGLHSTRDVDPARTRGIFRYGWSDTRDVQFQHYLNCLDVSDKPTLYFMHLLLPHLPWCYLPSGSRYAEEGEDWQLLSAKNETGLPGNWGPDELELINNQQRYLLQLVYLDQLVGKFIARLKQTGLYDRCLLVVTADHGISFRASQSRRSIGSENLDEILSIPLFVKRPGQQVGGVNDQDVESVDILPTIADVLGLTLGRATDGWSVFDTSHPQRKTKRFGHINDLVSVDPAIIHRS
ncbi:MAG: sulfatase, partial [Planctomycetaceae bacterium]|nr:sulfatase [Planctomycetaceae bacterium]